MRRLFLFLGLLVHTSLHAQISLVDTNARYFEDFNSLDSFGTGSTKLPSGWVFQEWGTAANTSYRSGTGSANASDTYSFGATQSRDRAFGSLASGTLTKVIYGTMFINHSGSDISSVSITYRGEQWRRGGSGTADSLRCMFTTVRGSALRDSSIAGWTEPPSLLFRSVSTLTGSAALNGNDSARVLHADLPLMLHPGDTLWLRWMDFNAAGSDDGLAIDSLSIEFRNGAVSQSNHPQLVAFSPDSNDAGLAPGLSLRLTFDRAVRPGTGDISVWDLGTNQIDRIPAVDGQMGNSGREYVFSGIAFSPDTRYLIRFDSSAFDSLGYPCTGNYGAGWIFRLAPVAVQPTTAVSGGRLLAISDGRLLLIGSAPEPDAELRVTAADGRLLRRTRIRHAGERTVIDPGLPGGSCYTVTVVQGGWSLQTRLCVP